MLQSTPDIVISLAALLALTGIVSWLARLLRMPEAALLTVSGLLIGFAVRAINPESGAPGQGLFDGPTALPSSEALLFIFLPPFLFAAGLIIDMRRLLEDVVPVLILAILAVVVCTVVSAYALAWVTGASLLICFLLGAIIATTDAAAVLTIFRDIGAPKRLTTLVEGESLFNDAAAIAIFSALLGFVAQGLSPPPTAFVSLFVIQLIGGVLVGLAVGKAIVWLIRPLTGVPLAEISLTVVLAYGAYFIAEDLVGVSGTIAVVCSAIMFGLDGRTSLSPGAWRDLTVVWRLFDYWAAALILLLAAIAIPLVLEAPRWSDLVPPLVLFVAAILARAAVLYGLLPAMTKLNLATPLSPAYKLILLWGGLRGAVTILLALSVLDVPMLMGAEGKRFLLVTATLYVVLTLILQGPTLRPLMRLLSLTKLTGAELDYLERVRGFIDKRVTDEMAAFEADLRSLATVQRADDGLPAPDTQPPAFEAGKGEENRLAVALAMLTTREQEIYLDFFARGVIGRRQTEALRAHADRVFEGSRTRGVTGYLERAVAGLSYGLEFRTAHFLQRRLGVETPLRRAMAARIESHYVKQLALVALRRYADEFLCPVLGTEKADVLRGALARRMGALSLAVEAIRLQFPAYAEQMEGALLTRMRLGLEKAEIQQNFASGVVTRDMYEELEAGRQERVKSMPALPKLDLGFRLKQMLRGVALLKDIPEADLQQLAGALQPQFMVPRETLIRQGTPGHDMFFIASGTVSVQRKHLTTDLKAGDHFGELALLTGGVRNASVEALTYGTLLRLNARDFRRLTARNEVIKSRLAKAAEARR